MKIHILQGKGIISGIKSALEQNSISTSKIDGSIWSQVMQEVSAENNTRESYNKIYEGGSDLSGSYKDNFVVKLATGHTEKIIELAQDTWNKIVLLVTGNNTPVETPVASTVKVETESPVIAPTTGDVVTVKNEDGTTYQINSKEHTIAKFDADGNVIEQRAMTDKEQALSTNDLIKNLQKPTVPTQEPEVETEAPIKTPKDDGQKQLSQEQIQQKVDNLQPGETFTYQETISGPGFNKTSPVKYTRNEDGTLSKVTYQLNGRKFSPLTTTYSQDGKVKSQQEISIRYPQAIVTKEFDDNGKVSSTCTDLSNYNEITMSLAFKLVSNLPNGRAKEQTVKNSDGQTLVIYKNGQFYNTKGKQITADKAYKILDKANDKKEIAQLIAEY